MHRLVLALLLVAGCDSSGRDRGSFELTLSGARTARIDGTAEFVALSCRSLSLSRDDVQIDIRTLCAEPDGIDGLRQGTLRVAPSFSDSTVFIAFYDNTTRLAYHGTGGTVEITGESDRRVTGRLTVEARRLRFDNTIDTTGTPLRIDGTFDAVGFAGLD